MQASADHSSACLSTASMAHIHSSRTMLPSTLISSRNRSAPSMNWSTVAGLVWWDLTGYLAEFLNGQTQPILLIRLPVGEIVRMVVLDDFRGQPEGCPVEDLGDRIGVQRIRICFHIRLLQHSRRTSHVQDELFAARSWHGVVLPLQILLPPPLCRKLVRRPSGLRFPGVSVFGINEKHEIRMTKEAARLTSTSSSRAGLAEVTKLEAQKREQGTGNSKSWAAEGRRA